MARKILGYLSVFLLILSLMGVFAVIYAENNPENPFLKPRPFVISAVASTVDAITGDMGKTEKTDTPGNINDGDSGEKTDPPPDYIELNVPVIFQNPKYPTGCEPVAATMLLNYYGYKISEDEFIEKMPFGSYPYVGNDGKRYGPDPDRVFVGDPKDPDSWGIYAKGLKNVIDSFLGGSGCVDITGCSIDDLYDLLRQGKPVIVWATINMEKKVKGLSWYIEGSGEFFTWIRKEHCYVLIGYDNEGNFIFNDPLEGRAKYNSGVFLEAFKVMGRQALYIDISLTGG